MWTELSVADTVGPIYQTGTLSPSTASTSIRHAVVEWVSVEESVFPASMIATGVQQPSLKRLPNPTWTFVALSGTAAAADWPAACADAVPKGRQTAMKRNNRNIIPDPIAP